VLTLTNASIFDGRKMLPGRSSVTLDGNRIAAIGQQPPAGSEKIIDLGGMTLMPGLTTCHLHPDFFRFTLAMGMDGQTPGHERAPGVLMAIGIRVCRVLLESGFTGYVGAACGHNIDAQLKMAIAEDIIPGPRIRACSGHIGTTADANDALKWWWRFDTPGLDIFANGPDDLRRVVREQIRRGAETVKFFASSGHAIPGHRGLRNMATDEIATIVNTAHDRGAKVRAHVSDKAMIRECLELGVDIIDHGDEVDEECVEIMIKQGTYWVPSLTLSKISIDVGFDGDGLIGRQYANICRMLPIAQKAGVKILIGDDYSGMFRDMVPDDPLDHQVGCYGREFAFYERVADLSPADILSWGTSVPGELLAGGDKVGVIEPGALADLIVIDGDPVADLSILGRPQQALKAVIRDGAFTIDRLQPQTAKRAAA
jgi:imidazolonepropionase-like amidohydrolase